MAQLLHDGRVLMSDKRIVAFAAELSALDICEIVRDCNPKTTRPFTGTPAFISGGGGGGSGAPGARGADGAPGPSGPQGPAGDFGGPQGFQGPSGPQGAVGGDGTDGAQGPQGFQGAGDDGAQGPQGFQGVDGPGGSGPQGFQGSLGPQGVQGTSGTNGVQGFQGPDSGGPDIFAATRVVSLVAGEGTDTTIAAAIAALPAEGGLIFVKEGTFPIAATLTLPNKNVAIRGAGNGSTILDMGANAIAAFTIPAGLTEPRVFAFADFRILGTAVANQRGWSIQDENSRGILSIERVDTFEIQIPFAVTDGPQDVSLLINATECYFEQLADMSSILITNSPDFPTVNLNLFKVDFSRRGATDTVLGTISQGGAGEFTNVYLVAKDSSFSSGADDCTLGGINSVNSAFYNFTPEVNGIIFIDTPLASGATNAIVGSDLFFVDFELVGDLKVDSCESTGCAWTDEAESQFSNCLFRVDANSAVPLPAIINGSGSTYVVGCEIGGSGTDYVLSDCKVVDGCSMDSATTAIILLTSFVDGGRVSNCDLGIGSSTVPILETGAAANNRYINNFAATGPTLLAGTNSIWEGARRDVASAQATTGVFVNYTGEASPTGLFSNGTIKNTGGNSLEVRETVTDGFGVTDSATQTITAGNQGVLSAQVNIGTARPPYRSYFIAVRHPGAATTFDLQVQTRGGN